jgi:hypothetical protein
LSASKSFGPFSEVKSEESSGMEVEAAEAAADNVSPLQQSTVDKLTKILSGEKSIFFHLQVFGVTLF